MKSINLKMKKKVEKIKITKTWYFEKIDKIHSVARLIPGKSRRHKCQYKFQQ